ncbi:phytanoyl-CoA dioxygenase family protein [Ancylothrix sp. C2]|uniref:phytanoyl-CoA dioxygenase family protein n=1 Tax=Ancylothrix sp. D3o TaxID=2953691 RepID=UPI0021BA60D3|nr:phytanoyl-CoA dioxygenase family protein [Ancylothrix sp. D3o]MCT7948421.1 phytanoyl-CoA dioxygenase family protein [Ancylothrix sp. D3o]
MLTQEQKHFWDENGYLILPAFFSAEQIDKVVKLHRRLWEECPSNVVVDDMETNRRCYMIDLSEEEKNHRCKVNDLYLNYEEIRDLSLNERLGNILGELLADVPVLCNTLSLDYGTEQFLHVDSLYMTPFTDHALVATWIALEDCHPNAGPLCYIPGSHKIPIYRFSSGSPHVIENEFPAWQEYMAEEVKKNNLKEEFFTPKKGDVFIWHAQLLHGGSAIKDLNLTRKSLVNHYFTKTDCVNLQSKLVRWDGGYWMNKPVLQVVQEKPTVEEKKEETKPEISQIEHSLRTTLHYFRLWKRDVFKPTGL